MVMVLYSDKKYEYQVVSCLNSIRNKVSNDLKILYVTIGFHSRIEFPNLVKQKIEIREDYPTFHFYKPEVCLLALDMFDDDDFIFSDTDVIFSPRFEPTELKFSEPYPIASFGPHEYPYYWESGDTGITEYHEGHLMKYLNVEERTQRYVISCFFTFNKNCRDFIEEWMSLCKNKYLLDRRKTYFPFPDETPFNVCLWKRNATKNLGFIFLNTHLLSTIESIESGMIEGSYSGNVLDNCGKNWEHIEDVSKILFYHGMKDKDEMELASTYISNI